MDSLNALNTATKRLDQQNLDPSAAVAANAPLAPTLQPNASVSGNANTDRTIQQAARNPRGGSDFIFADSGVQQDDATTARAVGHALESGKSQPGTGITGDDLVKVSDRNNLGTGALRMIRGLQNDPRANEPGGSVETFGRALLARSEDKGRPDAQRDVDRLGAYQAFTSSKELIARNLGSDDERAAAFKTLNEFNAKSPFQGNSNSSNLAIRDADKKGYLETSLAGPARLFNNYSKELTDASTKGLTPDTTPLRQFLGHTVFSPEAQGLKVDGKDLQASARTALGDAASEVFKGVENGANGFEKGMAARQFGALTGSVLGGAYEAKSSFENENKFTEASRKQFGDLVTLGIKDVVKDVPGAGPIVKFATDQAGKTLIEGPAKPSSTFADEFKRASAEQVNSLDKARGADTQLTNSFDQGFDNVINAVRVEIDLKK